MRDDSAPPATITVAMRIRQNLGRLESSLQNFAFSLAWTHNRSSTDFRDPVSGDRLPMPNTAERVARADLSYNEDGFGARLRYRFAEVV